MVECPSGRLLAFIFSGSLCLVSATVNFVCLGLIVSSTISFGWSFFLLGNVPNDTHKFMATHRHFDKILCWPLSVICVRASSFYGSLFLFFWGSGPIHFRWYTKSYCHLWAWWCRKLTKSTMTGFWPFIEHVGYKHMKLTVPSPENAVRTHCSWVLAWVGTSWHEVFLLPHENMLLGNFSGVSVHIAQNCCNAILNIHNVA